ncbi:MAG: pyruvate flavodoxin/ferredoxin oxidoreductase [Anaerolineae bacterium]|nr:pyruvate flavodoxin/ferredoxin oxidoreductase [Anaerolineae bacterium]
MREFVNGADAIARGALAAGCDFFAGYPITPATPILLHMIRELPKIGGVAIQGEDEIASIGMCVGAAMAGSRTMTATSGPGISLYSETIGMAIMGEVPLVIVNVQRMGPATGGATTVSQGDIQFMRWGTGGGYPVIVLAPTDVADCYRLTMRAFDLAEQFRVPVFLATDKETVASNATVDLADYEDMPVRARKMTAEAEHFIPYHINQPDDVPAMAHFAGPHIVRFTASSHDERGYLSKRPADVGALNNHLWHKVIDHVDEIALVEADLQPGADTLVLSYGITALAAEEAVMQARAAGVSVSRVTVRSLWPLPENALRAALAGHTRIIVAELNQGQYMREIERLACDEQQVIGVQRVDGGLIAPEQLIMEGSLA